jgi:2-keto-4-pentenoate hydratase/2-oxohepta-3-ene-1,7-dioic acid hydratase in catechol pathway
MKLVRFAVKGQIHTGILEGNTVIEVQPPAGDWLDHSFAPTGRRFDLSAVTLKAPCEPSKVVCVGLNYRCHAEEVKLELPRKPILFLKPSTAVIGPEEPIIYPAVSRRVDYESELGVVIGRRASRVRAAEALQYVFGYTCANDVTARDKQPKAGQWTYAKGFDSFCPLGPCIETGIDDPENLSIEGYLNGRLVQAGHTSGHIFPVAELIAFISGCMTLLPGDVIMTGTPRGIGPLQPGDRFAVVIEGIGRLENPCIAQADGGNGP